MYQYDIIVKYSDDKEYQESILKACNMSKEMDYNKQQIIINDIYNSIKDNEVWCNILDKVSEKHLFKKDKKLGIILLFSYDYFDKFHKCISDFKKNNSTEKVNKIL